MILIGSSILASQVWYWLDILLSMPLHGAAMINRITFQGYLVSTLSRSITMITWSTIFTGIQLWIEWNLQRERTEKANLLAHAAQLRMLRYQLNPHFLFNALNSIRALVEEDKKKAREMITELSEFLRYSLISRDYSDVPLSQELDAIRHYFAIEKKRYEEKLEVRYDVDPAAEEYPVLSFLIHPLVENAIKYGMQTSPMPLQITIQARVIDEELELEVSNTGRWVEPAAEGDHKIPGTRTGLENVRQRLENAFPGRHQFNVMHDNGQVRIKLRLQQNLTSTHEK
jgi:LytS/YehU family sensor histidine kinase